MRKLNLFCRIAGSLALIGGATSAVYKADWLLIISTILMAACLFTTVFTSTKGKKNIRK
ncbi:MAG: hypothetical protein ACOX2M_04220 [Fastidiosipilaceae bacterium]